MAINRNVSLWMSTRIGAVLWLFVVMVFPARLLAQDGIPVPTTSGASRNDPELLNLIIAHSRANLCKIQEWRGRVWMNPPYTALVINKFIDKLVTGYQSGTITEAIALTNNNTDAAWQFKHTVKL